MKEILSAKDARLEELELKVTRLEELEVKVTRLEKTIDSQKEREICSGTRERLMGRSVPRTCRELRASDPDRTLTSGMHFIDPDGQGVGDDPIYVYCDLTKDK